MTILTFNNLIIISATSGNFLIDPDGPLMGHEPFMVFCNFTAGNRYETLNKLQNSV